MRPVQLLLAAFIMTPLCAWSEEGCAKDKVGNSAIYVPVYSHIYTGDKLRPFNLASTISVRNTDSAESMRIAAADYYNSDGAKVRSLLNGQVSVPPLGAYSFKIKESDIEGGSGASVIISIKSSKPTSLPLLESVQVGTASGQGISFASRGRFLSCE